MLRPVLISFAAATFAANAHAEVVATQIIEKEVSVVDERGFVSIERVKADKVKPGEQVVYSLRFVNKSDEPAEGMVMIMPVPEEITYVEGSVSGADARVTFSADGGETYVARGRLTVSRGGAAMPATNDEITHIKWALTYPVEPQAGGEISFKGKLK